MNFSISLILFSCLFFYANSTVEEQENGEGSHSPKPPCTFRGQPFHCLKGGICEKFEQGRVDKCHKNEEMIGQRKAEFEQDYGKVGEEEYDFTRIEGIKEFLESTENAEQLLKVFKYLTHLKEEPICLTKATVDSLAKLNGHTEEEAEKALKDGEKPTETGCELLANKMQDSARLSREVLEKQREDKGAKGDAFLFGEEGVVEILIGEDGWKCAESLLHPEKVALLLQSVIKTLQANAGKSFVDTMHLVVENLDAKIDSVGEHPQTATKSSSSGTNKQPTSPKASASANGNSPKAASSTVAKSPSLKANAVSANGPSSPTGSSEALSDSAPKKKWTTELKEKWKNTWETLKKKGIREDLKDFAVWLLRPSHIDGLIQILLFLTGYAGIVDVSLLVLKLFDLDDLFTKGLEKIGVKIEEYTGAKTGLVKWGFGPNGVFPLFLRYGEFDDDTKEGEYQELLDQAKQVHKLKKMRREEEEEFLKKIIAELIEHKGRPMHELMDHLLENLDKMEERAKQSWAEHVAKWKEGWTLVKSHLHKNAIRADLKRFAVWFVTPDRANILIQVVLTATGTDVPVYFALSLLEMFGITQATIEGLEKVTIKNKDQKAAKGVEFVLGEDGVIAQFLQQQDLDDETIREDRNERAADLIKIVAEVIISHRGAGVLVAKLGEYLAETVQSQEFYLEVIQAWNLLVEEHNQPGSLGSKVFGCLGHLFPCILNPDRKGKTKPENKDVKKVPSKHEQEAHVNSHGHGSQNGHHQQTIDNPQKSPKQLGHSPSQKGTVLLKSTSQHANANQSHRGA